MDEAASATLSLVTGDKTYESQTLDSIYTAYQAELINKIQTNTRIIETNKSKLIELATQKATIESTPSLNEEQLSVINSVTLSAIRPSLVHLQDEQKNPILRALIYREIDEQKERIDREQRMLSAELQEAEIIQKLGISRPPTISDIAYRNDVITEVSEVLSARSPENYRFHSTSLHWSLNIIAERQLVSGMDRHGVKTSFDKAGEISVTNKSNVNLSLGYYLDPHEICLPLGCTFVISPANETDTISSLSSNTLPNFNFQENSDQLIAILCSRESLEMVKNSLRGSGLPDTLAREYTEFATSL